VNVIVSPHLYSSGFLSVTPLIQGLFTAAKQQAVAAMTQENATALFIPQFLQPTPFRYFTRYNTTVDERFSERDIPNSPEATDFFASVPDYVVTFSKTDMIGDVLLVNHTFV
jgi:hypothetical protein